jgi:hypothetical protein
VSTASPDRAVADSEDPLPTEHLSQRIAGERFEAMSWHYGFVASGSLSYPIKRPPGTSSPKDRA